MPRLGIMQRDVTPQSVAEEPRMQDSHIYTAGSSGHLDPEPQTLATCYGLWGLQGRPQSISYAKFRPDPELQLETEQEQEPVIESPYSKLASLIARARRMEPKDLGIDDTVLSHLTWDQVSRAKPNSALNFDNLSPHDKSRAPDESLGGDENRVVSSPMMSRLMKQSRQTELQEPDNSGSQR